MAETTAQLSRVLSAPADTSARHGLPVHKLGELKSKLQAVASSRGRQYTKYLAVLVSWETDNTNAAQDVQSMKTLLTACFAFDVVNVLTLSGTDRFPGWTVESAVQELLKHHFDPKTPLLLIFYYAGHGMMIGRDFYLTNSGKLMVWSRLQQTIFGEFQAELKNRLDSLAILDCCFGGNAGRATAQSGSTTQILAASTGIAHKRKTEQVSFTQRLYRAAYDLRSQGPTVTIPALFQRIFDDQPKNRPSLVTVSGTQPIVLVYNRQDQSRTRIPAPRTRTLNEKHIMVKLTVHGGRDAFRAFADVIKSLPRGMAAEITDAYETDSSFFSLLRLSMEAYALWTMAVDLEMIGVTFGSSLVHQPGLTEQVGSSDRVENIPRREKKE
ncbi:hypothetical protein N7540_003358 [Penicillium herquei]|nr:hypothetical protein N7540_003358 [Penicillium herquei]